MEFVLKALEGIFSIVFIIGIGFVLSRRGWFDEYSSALIARLVTAVSLPLYMIVSISKNTSLRQNISGTLLYKRQLRITAAPDDIRILHNRH